MDTKHIHHLAANRLNDAERETNWFRSFFGFFKKSNEAPLSDLDNQNDKVDIDEDKNHQETLIANVLNISGLTAEDVMLPRADIVAIDITATSQELLSLLTEKTFSRIPVFKESLDDIVGCINSKDVLVCLARGELPVIRDMIRDVMIVSPSLDALDLLLEMRESRKHMALVVDEFGGIDGLITIGDMIEDIVGEIEDEHADQEEPELIERADGVILADARVSVADFQEKYGVFLSPEEAEDIDTLGGLVMSLAGRMPTCGELLTHDSGLEIEIVEADGRRIKRLRIHQLPKQNVDRLDNE